MKKILYVLFFLAGFFLTAAVKEGEGGRLLDRQTALLSARLLHAKWSESWLAAKEPSGEKELYDWMSRNLAASVSVGNAEKLSEKIYRQKLADDYELENTTLLKPFVKVLTPEELNEFQAGASALVDRKLRAGFPEDFQKARARLCAEQRAALFRNLYPSEAELENETDAALTRNLTARFLEQASAPVLEENIPLFKTQMILPVLKSARTQQKRQLELASSLSVPPEIWDADAAEQSLRKQLESMVAQWKEPKVYGLFPRTLAVIRQRAARLPEDRVTSRLSRYAAVPDYARMLKQAPLEHIDAKKSFARLSAAFCSTTLENALRMSDMPAKYVSVVRQDKKVRQAIQSYFDRQVCPALQKIRDQEAAAQMREYFPTLVNGKWKPTPEEVEVFYSAGQNWIPTLDGIDFSRRELLEETQAKLEQTIVSKLKNGGKELARQEEMVDLEYDSVVREMSALETGKSVSFLERWLGLGDGHVSLEQIRKRYEERVKTAFNEGMTRDYPGLFDRVSKEIEIRSRAILQRISTVNEAKEDSPALTPVKTVRCVIRINAENERLSVKLGKKEWTGSLRKEDYKTTEEKITSGVIAEIQRISAENAAKNEKFRLEVQVLVLNGKIYYEFVANLRETLRKRLSGSSPQVSDSLNRD